MHIPADAPRVLVIRRRYVGDVVLLGSVFRNLRLHWPAAKISVLTEAAYSGILLLSPDVDCPLILPGRAREWPAFLRTLANARFTHVLDFDNTEKTALISWFTRAAVRVTFQYETTRFRYPFSYTHTAKIAQTFYDTHHITETYLALLTAIGVSIVSREVKIVPRPKDRARIAPFARPRSAYPGLRPPLRVLVHPGSRSPYRVWPPERFARVCDQVQEELGAQVFLIAGPAEQPWLQKIRAMAHTHLVELSPFPDVATFAAALTEFDLLLCHDSGPMHLAAAVGTPVVALFGSQNATVWRPLGEHHTILQTALPCACLGSSPPTPCVRHDSYRSYCVRQLEPNDVFAAIRTSLRQLQRPSVLSSRRSEQPEPASAVPLRSV